MSKVSLLDPFFYAEATDLWPDLERFDAFLLFDEEPIEVDALPRDYILSLCEEVVYLEFFILFILLIIILKDS